jgi:5-methylcytosine-specific restriction endonuclease McrA
LRQYFNSIEKKNKTKTQESYKLPSGTLKLKYKEIAVYRSQQLLEQKSLCALCGDLIDGDAVLDHDHKTNSFRGWLCQKCNRGLGNFDDDLGRMNRAIKYLEENNERSR